MEFDDLADALRKVRVKRKMTQELAASIMGVTQQTYSNWEHGSTPRPTDTDEYRDVIRAIAAFISETVPETLRLAYFPGETEDPRHVVSQEVMSRVMRLESVAIRLEAAVARLEVRL